MTSAASQQQDKRRSRKERAAEEDRRTARLRVAGLAVALVVMTFVAFAPVLKNDFVAFDDMEAIVHNPAFNPPAFANFTRFWTEPVPDLYTPVMWTAWGLLAFVARSEWPMVGVHWDATPFHLLNLAAHAGAAVMALLVLRRLVRSDLAAFVGAALFALHPLQAEPVAWAAAMKTPLSGFFALWSIWHYLTFSEERSVAFSRRAWLHYGLATLAFVLALITKPTVVVLPVVIAAIEVLMQSRRVRDVVLPLAPWVAVALLIGWVNAQAQSAPTIFRPPAWQRVLIAGHSLGFYLLKLVLPYPLLPDYSRTPQFVAGSWRMWAGAVPVIALGVVALAFRRRAPWVCVAVVIFVLGVITTSGLIPYDYQLYTTVADRYAYLSLFGVAMIVAFGVARSRGTRARIVAAVVLLACAGITFTQCLRWRDTQTLFRHTLAHNPHSLAAYRSLTFDAIVNGRVDAATSYARDGLRERPGDVVLLQFVGNLAMQQGRFDEAADAFRSAAAGGVNREQHLNGLGAALAQAGRLDEAEAAFTEALAVAPEFAEARRNLLIVIEQRNRARRQAPPTRPTTATAPTSGPATATP